MNRQPGAGARKDFAPEHVLLCDLDSQSSLGEEKLMWTEGEEASSLQSSSTVPLLLLLLLLLHHHGPRTELPTRGQGASGEAFLARPPARTTPTP